MDIFDLERITEDEPLVGSSIFAEGDVCPTCDHYNIKGVLVKRTGQYGDFIGCSNYPKCTFKH